MASWVAAFLLASIVTSVAGHSRRLGATPSFSTSAAASDKATGFEMKSRIYVPYGKGVGFAFGMGAAEQIAYDATEKYVYTVSEQGAVNIVDYQDATAPALKADWAIDLNGNKLTDVEICGDHVYVGVGASDTVGDGKVLIYTKVKRANYVAPSKVKELPVGALPDMVLPNSDCSMLAVANEGEGTYTTKLTDPVGSVTIIKNPTASSPEIHTVTFDSLGTDDELIAKGVHLPLSKKAMEYWQDYSGLSLDFTDARANYKAAMNLEPEYLGWSSDGKKLYVNLQENNAIVTVEVSGTPAATSIDSLGLKDWSSTGGTNGIDLVKDDKCTMAFYEGFYSLRSSDSIAVVNIDGQDYIITANEGDDKEYGDFEEKAKEKDVIGQGAVKLKDMSADSAVLTNQAAHVAAGSDSKRTLTLGSAAIDYSTPSAPVWKKLVSMGGRGVSIFKTSSSGLELKWDSKSEFETEQCKAYPWAHNGIQDEEFALTGGVLYNASGSSLRGTIEGMNNPDEDGCSDRGDGIAGPCPLGKTVDERSPKDGAGVEAVVTGVACGRLMMVACTEKASTAFAYDITDVSAPELLFVKHLSPASETKSPEIAYAARELGEIDPESMVFLEDAHSPSGKAGVLFAGAWSGTVSFWEFSCPSTYSPQSTKESSSGVPAAASKSVTKAMLAAVSAFMVTW